MTRAAILALGVVMALSRDARGAALSYVGAEGGDWDTAANWSPAQVPTASDDVTIDGLWVQSAGSISAKSILVKGSAGALTVAGTVKTVTAQVIVADRTAAVALTVAGDLVVDGGKFSLGAQGAPYNVSATIGGDLVVTNGATAAFHAGETDGVDAIDQSGTAAKLYANMNVITVTGTFLVGTGSTVIHESNRLSGTPVLFKVKDFTQEAGAVNTAEGRGWAKITYASNPPVRTIKEDVTYTYALGAGGAYTHGSGHGGEGGSPATYGFTYVNADGTTSSKNYRTGGSYGYAFAPFLPGSPNGFYNSVGYGRRGGGAICIWASGSATISGTLNVKGVEGTYGSSAAGSIWLAAKRFSFVRSASLVAEGGTCKNYSTAGGGGRVALAIDVTESELDQLAANVSPADLSLLSADAYGVSIDVLGGANTGGAGGRAGSGTAKLVWKSGSVPYEVAGTPTEYSTATPAYGFYAKPSSEVPSSFTTADSSVYPELYRNLRRYAHEGVVVTEGSTVISVADIPNATEPVTVTHQWTGIEDLVRLRIVGGGSVTLGGASYTTDTDIWRTAGTTVGATAVAGSGSFVRWIGDFTNGVQTTAAIEPAIVPGQTLWAVFSDAATVAKTYSGAAGGFWDVASNWSPAGVPTPMDDVTIPSGLFVKSYTLAAAKSLTLTGGKLAIGGMNEPKVAVIALGNAYDSLNNQAKPTDYALVGSGLFVGGAISLTGAAQLSLGAYRQATPYWCLSAEGDVALANTSRMTAYAKTYEGPVNASGKIDLTNHYSQATVVKIGGHLTLSDTAWVLAESEAATGVPVKWQVASNVTVGASAGFDATGRGYQWIDINIEGSRDSRYVRQETRFYTLSPGYGYSYQVGGSYGGSYDDSYGVVYGFDVAPYLAGGPSGADGDYSKARSGGAVWIVCGGDFTLNGSLSAKGARPGSTGSGAAGGSIWVAAKKYSPGTAAKMDAGGGRTGWELGTSSGGCGGRICVAEGVADEQLAELAATGERLEALTFGDSIAGTTASVAGGFSKTDSSGVSYYGKPGTIVHVTGEVSEYPLEIYSTPVKCRAEGLDYTAQSVEKGKVWSMTIGAYGYDPADAANVRYSCASWVISNTVEEVAHGSGSTASFTPVKGPFTLTWSWNDRHVRHAVNVPEHATMTVNGTAYAEATSVWIADATPVTMAVTPDEGYEFLCWEGPIPFGQAQLATLALEAGLPYDLTPIVRPVTEATTRTWLGGTGSWADAAKWDPSGIPGAADTLLVGSGTCVVSNFLACGALTLSGTAAMKVAEKASTRLEEAALVVHGDLVMTNKATLLVAPRNDYRHGRLVVDGDFRMVGTNTLTVSAGPTNLTTFTCAKGAGWVTVGRDLVVAGKSTVIPNSAPWTGGSVVFRTGRTFTLGAEAAFRANDNGYQRVSGRVPISLGPGTGLSWMHGAGHGGYGIGYYAGYGYPYGFEFAPVEPGSPCGDYGDHPGGGLIRIHAGSSATIAGELNANARAGDTDASSASGGGIWVTAGWKLTVADTAILKARGGYRCTGAGTPGGGGRIALGQKLSSKEVEELAETGSVSTWRKFARRDKTEAFLAEHPNVTIDVRGGEDNTGVNEGTFHVLNGSRTGFAIIIP